MLFSIVVHQTRSTRNSPEGASELRAREHGCLVGLNDETITEDVNKYGQDKVNYEGH